MSDSTGQSSQIQDLREDLDSLCIYLFRQTSLQARQMSSQRETINQLTEEGNKLGAAVAQFQAFGLRAPDFAPILAKYGLKPEPLPVGTNAPASAPKK
jgi:hypothetical protein